MGLTVLLFKLVILGLEISEEDVILGVESLDLTKSRVTFYL